MKDHKSVLIATAAVAALVLLALGITYYHQESGPRQPPAPPTINTAFVPPQSVVVHETVAGNVHTFSGLIPVPSGCSTLATGITASSAGTSSIVVWLRLTVLNTGGDNCQTISGGNQQFSASFAPAKADSIVTLGSFAINGVVIPFTVSASSTTR